MADATILFGGGINAQARTADVHDQECTAGENFHLKQFFSGFKARKPFDLLGTATNTSEIRGWAQLLRSDGTVSTLIQAGTTVYEWDFGSTFTSRGTVNAGTRLRGTANFTLTEKALITDLNKATPVKQWDGVTFETMPHNLGGDFFAKYCIVDHERAIFGNIRAGADTPHLLVGSKGGDNEALTVTDKPSSALSNEDPWYIPIADFRPINGLVNGIGDGASIVISTENGKLRKLIGSSAQDFAIDPFFVGSASAGAEAIVNTGNDVVFGRPGAIESLAGVQQFGDVKTDDLSRWIDVEDVSAWTIVYDPTTQRVYCLPKDGSSVLVLHKEMLAAGVSPWSEWTTTHAMAFQPSSIFTLRSPDGRDRVYMGDSTGKLYQLDGSGSQDGGTDDVTAFRIPKLIWSHGALSGVKGYVDYVKNNDAHTLTLEGRYAGIEQFDKSETVAVPALTTSAVYGTTAFYGTTSTYGTAFKDRPGRRAFEITGESSAVQIKASLVGSACIDKIWFQYKETAP